MRYVSLIRKELDESTEIIVLKDVTSEKNYQDSQKELTNTYTRQLKIAE